MLPMEFDSQILNSLPLPNEHAFRRVLELLQSLVAQKLVPYFRLKRGTDLIHLGRVKQNLTFQRLDDDNGNVRLVSVLSKTGSGWNVHLHERIFDYLAFVTPLTPDGGLTEGNAEERKMHTFMEFLLRHNIEHMLYPERKERDIIFSDIEFAMNWRREDPTAYRLLCLAFSDEMNGIRGSDYLELLENAREGKPNECVINRMTNTYSLALADLPESLIETLYLLLDSGIKARVLGEYYRVSRSTTYSLMKRSASFQRILRLFSLMVANDHHEALEIFNNLKERWGVVSLFHELDLPEAHMDEKDTEELFRIFHKALKNHPAAQPPMPQGTQPAVLHVNPEVTSPPPPPKSLKERVEEARNNPYIPRSVIELIERNKQNAAGQSGAKYTELIETLLAIPWGVIRRIRVSPTEFEEGINTTHYGLRKPKEILSDIFTNLIWRYQQFKDVDQRNWTRMGSALLFVGPPGVGKTSLAISIAKNLGIPYHKLSLGGMRDEADIRGYGFTYEGSKPGPIVQGLIKMGTMNGMFILDEADKTEKVAIATLLEILDPEQNHLFHDKYTQSTVDIDLSNSHFILTANTLETVPAAVLDRCEIIVLSRYSVEEKIAIARRHLISRIREKHMIREKEIFFSEKDEPELLRFLIRNYTFEAGVRDLERVIRTLFLRVHRKEVIGQGKRSSVIVQETIKEHLEEPFPPRRINDEDRVGEMMALGVNLDIGLGTLIPIQVTPIRNLNADEGAHRGHMSILHATGNIERIMDESRKVATTAISHCAEQLAIDVKNLEDPVHLHFMGGSTRKDGPSAGGSIALALSSFFRKCKIRRDVAMTGEIDTQGRITGIGGLGIKLETAYGAGCKTMLIPRDNLHGNEGLDRLPEGLRQELQILTYQKWKEPHEPFDYTRHVMQVVAVEDIVQAADVAFIDQEEIHALEELFSVHAQNALQSLNQDSSVPMTRLRLLHLSQPEELDLEFLKSGICEGRHGCMILAAPRTMAAVNACLEGLSHRVKVRPYDSGTETLTEVIQEVRSSFSQGGNVPLRMSLIAPYTVFVRDGIQEQDFPPSRDFAGLRLFASCCTVENVQIKDCRNIINRAFRQLVLLRTELLDACPFLVKHDGVYMISLEFIPEKYRLDANRSEEILHSGLTRWLSIMEGLQEEPRWEEAAGEQKEFTLPPMAAAPFELG